MKKKLAFVVDYYPYLGGYANRIVEQIKLLSLEFDVYLFYLFKKDKVEENIDISQHVVGEHRLPSLKKVRKTSSEVAANPFSLLSDPMLVLNAIKNLILGSIPLYFAPYYSGASSKKLAEIMEKEGISLIWANGILGGALTRNIKAGFKVLDLCDSRYVLYSTLEKIERSHLKLFFMKIDKQLTRIFEKNIVRDFDVISYICARDGLAVGHLPDQFVVLPNIRKIKRWNRSEEKKLDVLMVGRWDYLPNYDGLNFTINEIAPLLRGRKISVIGPISEEHRKRLSVHTPDNIKLIGVVDDLEEYLALSRIMLVPIRAGAGVQNKALDGMEAGIPVFTTPFVKSGVDSDNACDGIIVCKDAKEFTEKMEDMLVDSGKQESLGRAAREFFEETNRNALESYKRLIKRMKDSFLSL